MSSSYPGPRGARNFWDEGVHQHHAPSPGPGRDPMWLVAFVIVAVCAVIAGGVFVWGCM